MAKKTKIKALLLWMGLLLLSPTSWALDSGIEVEGIDTVAGYSALLRISNAPGEKPLELWIEKPDGSEVVLETKSDEYGKAKVDLEGFYTKRAGDYAVKARVVGEDDAFGSTSMFTVYADTVSSSRSTLSTDRNTALANGNDYIAIEVQLRDRYNNPIAGHSVSLISSRLNDEILRISKNPYTDPQGTLLFHVYSREVGVSTFVANDSTSSVTLNDRAKIAYYTPDQRSMAVGGETDVLLASSSSSGPVNELKIEDLSSEARVGETLNFTVTAYDSDMNTANNYTGTVRFSSSDNNANLPEDYTFEAEDQGTHTFSLSLSFNTTGTQTLSVTDLEDMELRGTIDVTVSNSGTGNSTATDSGNSDGEDDAFAVYTPTAGTYSSNSLSFSGKAKYGWTVEIRDNGTLIGSTPVKADGTFSYTTSNLEEGTHSFTVSTVDDQKTLEEGSEAIAVTIDTQGPEIDTLQIDPEGSVSPGESFTVTLYTEKNLPEVSVLFNNQLFDLTEDLLVAGMYAGTFTAPQEAGTYEFDMILVDEVGNEASYKRAGIVDVTLENALDKEAVPGPITGLEAVEGDGRVTLSWEPPCELSLTECSENVESTTDVTEVLIDHYRIYYGPDPELLYSHEDTFDSSTTWYVDELDNGSTYHFKIVAVTAEGTEGTESEAVASTPKSSEESALYQAALEDDLDTLTEQAEINAINQTMEEEETPETGPEILWLMGMSVGFGYFYFREPLKNVVSLRNLYHFERKA